jgi:hypothetical protein
MHEQDGPASLEQRLINPGGGAILGGLLLGALVARVEGRGGGGVKAAYVACCGVCVLMVCWVLVFPGKLALRVQTCLFYSCKSTNTDA